MSAYLATEVLALTIAKLEVSFAAIEVLSGRASRIEGAFVGVEVLCAVDRPIDYVPPPNVRPWPIPPDWRSGVTERLKWKTDVIPSQTGVEQRRRMRGTPRRTIEADYRAYGRDRRLMDALLVGAQNQLWQVPLWWEKCPLDLAALSGSHTLVLDYRWTEFHPGDTIMIYGGSPFLYEMVKIKSTTLLGDQLELENRLAVSWEAGTPVYNTRLCRLVDKVQTTRKADDATDAKIVFDTVQPNDYPSYPPPSIVAGVYLQVEFQPNFLNDLTLDYERLYALFDNETGLTARVDLADRAFTVMQFEYMAVGRQASDRFRGFLYWLAGKLREIVVPSYFEEIEIPPGFFGLPGDRGTQIVSAGYSTYIGANVDDRKVLLFSYRDGTQELHTITSAQYVGQFQNFGYVEYVELTPPLTKITTRETISRVSYMVNSRQDTDDLEIKHETDTRGVTQFSTVFRSIGPKRTSVPYAFAFNGQTTRNADPPRITVDINRYQPPPHEETPTIVKSIDTPEQGSNGNASGNSSSETAGEDG